MSQTMATTLPGLVVCFERPRKGRRYLCGLVVEPQPSGKLRSLAHVQKFGDLDSIASSET